MARKYRFEQARQLEEQKTMARHESEMHRQRQELREALQNIIRAVEADMSPGGWMTRVDKEIAAAKDVLRRQAPCNAGLFGDHSQMDLQDRKDI